MIELKERLSAIAKYVPRGSKVIDVGTDHAYLPIYLVQRGICPAAVATDIHEGPYRSAVEQVRMESLTDKITVYWGDGLKPVAQNQGDVAVIAGMGGTTIVEILQASPRVLTGIRRLVLQPMVAADALRRWLIDHGWAIIDEELVEEDKRIYEVLSAEPGEKVLLQETELELGPCIIRKKGPLLARVVQDKIRVLNHILEQMEKSNNLELNVKKEAIRDNIRRLREVSL